MLRPALALGCAPNRAGAACFPYPTAAAETIGTMFPFQITAGVNWINHSQAMVSNVVGVASWVGIARFMYIKKIFINV